METFCWLCYCQSCNISDLDQFNKTVGTDVKERCARTELFRAGESIKDDVVFRGPCKDFVRECECLVPDIAFIFFGDQHHFRPRCMTFRDCCLEN